MTELDMVGNSEHFNYRGGGCPSYLQEALAGNAKIRLNVCMLLVLLYMYIYSKILGVRLPACPVIKIKVLVLIKV